jgi:hypothetical protein
MFQKRFTDFKTHKKHGKSTKSLVTFHGSTSTSLSGEFCCELFYAGLALPGPLHQHLRLALLLLQLCLQRRNSKVKKKILKIEQKDEKTFSTRGYGFK